MKFLLVRPPMALSLSKHFHAFLHLEPLDLEFVAAGIPTTHETRILDLTVERQPFEKFAAVLHNFGPDMVGFGGYSNQASHVKHLAALAKKSLPGCLTIVGGIHATIVPSDYRLPGVIDLVIRGEGATALRALIAALEQGHPPPDDDRFLPVDSPAFETRAALPPPALPDYDHLPWPRRDLVDRSKYFCVWSGAPGERLTTLFPRVATVRSSTGCPHRCNFCVVHHLANGKYLQRSPDDVVAEIASVPEDHIYFVDDEMFINARRAETIATLLLQRGIRKHYISWARSDTICKHPDMFRLWKKAGLDVVYVGLESLNPETLLSYNKGCEAETNRKAIGILRDTGIILHAALMVNPDFSKDDFLALRRAIDTIAPAEMSFTVFSPPPGTALWEKHHKDFISPDPFAFYDCMHTLLPTRLRLNVFYRYFSLLYLFGFRHNPWRSRRIKAPIRDLWRMFMASVRCGYALRTIYKDYPKALQ